MRNNTLSHQLAQLRRQLRHRHSGPRPCLPKSCDRQLVHPNIQHVAKRASTHPTDAREYQPTADRYRIFAITCPFHGNAGWRWVRDNDPDGWAEAVEFDRAIRHGYPHATTQGQELRGQYFLHRSCLPLDQVDLDAPTKSRSKKHLRLITSESADVAVDSVEEDGDPDGCSPWSCRSGEQVTAVDHGHHERAA